jgi:hypothetical protein
MEAETARTLGYMLGMATMGFVVLKVLTRGRKPPPAAPGARNPDIAGAWRTIIILVVIGVIATAIGAFVNR